MVGYDVAIWGSLKFPSGSVDAWRKRRVDGRAWSDWPMWFENAESREPVTVEKHLAEWARFGEGSEFFAVSVLKSRVSVQGFVSEDLFIERAQAMAALFRVAGQVGAMGNVTFVGVGAPLAYKLTLTKEGSNCEALESAGDVIERSPEVMEVIRAAEKHECMRKEAQSLEKEKTKAGPTKRDAVDEADCASDYILPPDAATAMEGIHEILEHADSAALLAAPSQIDYCAIRIGGSRPARVEETFKTRESMLLGLRGKSNKTTPADLTSLHGAAILIAAALDAKTTESLARQVLLSAAPTHVRAQAALALTGSNSDDTVEALFSALAEEGCIRGGKRYGPYANQLRRAVEHALSEVGSEDVGARVLELLTPKALKIKAGITGDFVDASFKEKEKEDYVRALLYILGRLKYRPARARLVEILRTHHLTELKLRAAEAVLFGASAEEIQQVFGEKPETFFTQNVTVGVFNRQKVIPYAERLIASVEERKP